jgi:hypothetical protein
VSEVFSQMGGKKLTTTISVKPTKKIVRRFLLSIIYPIVNWRFVRKQTELLTAESQDRFVTGSNKKLSLSVGSVDGRECLLRTGSGAVGRFGR